MADLLLVLHGYEACNGNTDVLSYQLAHVKERFTRLMLIQYPWIILLLNEYIFRPFCKFDN